jgi:hypothetical protein
LAPSPRNTAEDKFGKGRSKVRSKKELRNDRVSDANERGRRRRGKEVSTGEDEGGDYGVTTYEIDFDGLR